MLDFLEQADETKIVFEKYSAGSVIYQDRQ